MDLKKVIYIKSTSSQTAEERFNILVSTGTLDGHTYDPDKNDYRIQANLATEEYVDSAVTRAIIAALGGNY